MLHVEGGNLILEYMGFWIRVLRLYYIVINKFAENAPVAHKDLTNGIEMQYRLNKRKN